MNIVSYLLAIAGGSVNPVQAGASGRTEQRLDKPGLVGHFHIRDQADRRYSDSADCAAGLAMRTPREYAVSDSKRDRSWNEASKAVKKIADDLWNGRYFPSETSGNRELPVMLPFSIGRDEEERRFEIALAYAPGATPFVCILSGSRQGQKQFIDRLAREDGPIRRYFASSRPTTPSPPITTTGGSVGAIPRRPCSTKRSLRSIRRRLPRTAFR